MLGVGLGGHVFHVRVPVIAASVEEKGGDALQKKCA